MKRIMRNALGLLLTISLMLIGSVDAGAFTKKGTTAADFLKIGIGGRSVAMAGAVTACPEGLEALYWNPAGLAGSEKRLFGVVHTRWIADLSHDFIALAVPASRNLTVAAYAISLAMDEMEQTTITEPEGTGVYFDYGDLAIGAGLGVRMTDRFRVGGTAKIIYTRAFNESATAFALDVGTHLVTTFHGLAIGMNVSNFGTNMKLDGQDLIVEGDSEPGLPGNELQEARLETNDYPLPLIFRIGIAMDVVGTDPAPMVSLYHRLTLALDGIHFAENVEQVRVAAEYGFREIIFLRGGYHFGDDSRDWAAGVGLALSSGTLGVRADFGYENMGVFNPVPRVGLTLEF